MTNRDNELLRQLAGPIYLVAALLVVLPLLDFVTNIIPINLGEAHWRYGMMALVGQFFLTPLLGSFIALLAAAALGHTGVLRWMGMVYLVLGGLLLIALVGFLLDVFQVRAGAPPAALHNFDIGWVRALVKELAVAGTVIWLGLRARRAGRAGESARPKRSRRPPTPLVMGQGDRD